MTVLLFITMIIIFLGADFIIQRKRSTVPIPHPTHQSFQPMRVPLGIFFSPSHTWLSLFPSGNVRIGVDEFVLRMMEKPEVVFLKNSGSETRRGEPLLQLKEGARTLTAHSPIDGEIVELNDSLRHHPEALKEMLFSDGWACTVRPKRLSDLTLMFLGEQTRTWIQQELGRLRDFIAGSSRTGSLVPAMLQDGGLPVEGLLNHLDEDQCTRFEQQFMIVH